jgi:hypothetical protein
MYFVLVVILYFGFNVPWPYTFLVEVFETGWKIPLFCAAIALFAFLVYYLSVMVVNLREWLGNRYGRKTTLLSGIII